jgi:Spy/CpxP family protein refolding chaperone
MISLVRKLCIPFLAMIAIPVAASAQDNPPPPQGRGLERVEQYKKIRLMEVLNLDEQNSIKFFARYNKHQALLRDLRKQQVQVLGDVQALRKDKAADDAYDKVVDELLVLENKVTDAKAKYIDELKQVLTSKQLAEYLVFETRFQQNLRDLVRDIPRTRQAPLNR